MSAFWHFIECKGKALIQALSLTGYGVIFIFKMVEHYFETNCNYSVLCKYMHYYSGLLINLVLR